MAGVRGGRAGRRDSAQGGVTAVVQDYLKVIWQAQEWSPAPVTTSALARRLDVGAPTVSETLGRLADRGWVRRERYGEVDLTPAGRRLAVTMVRRHRLLETWLVVHLGYGWDEVHDEAEELEHAVSERFVERIDALLGRPTRDPHGDPIPDAQGNVTLPDAVPLVDLPAATTAVVARISDADPEILRDCARAGIGLDSVITTGTVLPAGAAQAIHVLAPHAGDAHDPRHTPSPRSG